ncbi:MAG: discoidin domain-containing protein [Candidatus Nanopelagicales bacterium]
MGLVASSPAQASLDAGVIPQTLTQAKVKAKQKPAATKTTRAASVPTASTVGWAANGTTKLTAYTGPNVITTAGTVIDGRDISGAIEVRADNVTIRNSRILAPSSANYVVLQRPGFAGLKLSYVEVASLSGQHADRAIASWGTNMTVDHAYVHGTQRGIEVGDGTVISNTIADDFDNSSSSHASALMSLGGAANVTVVGNVLGCNTGRCSAAMSVYPQVDFGGPNTNWTIDSNVFNGGGYCVYLGYSPASGEEPNTNMKVTNNRFGNKYNAQCGYYGPIGSWSWSAGNIWTNNTWYAPGSALDGTTLVPAGAPAGTGSASASATPTAKASASETPAGASGNLSLGHAALASSWESTYYSAGAAVDSSLTSRWASEVSSSPQWLRIDLGSQRTITSVALTWETAYATAFEVQASGDGSTWTTLYSTAAGTGGKQTLAVNGTGRYVRIYATVRVRSWYGYSLFDVTVLGY